MISKGVMLVEPIERRKPFCIKGSIFFWGGPIIRSSYPELWCPPAGKNTRKLVVGELVLVYFCLEVGLGCSKLLS